ncbi:MAG: HAD family hydrolase [Bacteroidota bacterium]
MHPTSLDTALALIQSGTVAVFSFDVFDTTLLRRCPSPDGVFEQAFRLAPIPANRTALAESYCQQRVLTEAKLRTDAIEKKLSPEVPIGDIYRHFPTAAFGIARDQWQALAEAEFQAECTLCFINPDIFTLIRAARAKGIKVGFLSDTYWSGEQLSRLLRHCAPELEWDFLYASCDHQTGKSDALFARLLADLGVSPSQVAHMGDNETADVRSARKAGIQAVYYPQSSPELGVLFQRETSVFKLIWGQNGAPVRRDDGTRTLRRKITASAGNEQSDAFRYGVSVLGPVMATFDRFVHDRITALKQQGRTVAVAFLARDGLLPLQVWQAVRQDPASYCEINRRIALIGGSVDIAPIQHFFRRITLLDNHIAAAFLKHDLPAMARYFKGCKGGRSSGEALADALPDLLTEQDIAAISSALRKGVLAHLRATIPNFDQCDDLVLVDLGYSGTVQKAMRTILNLEGCRQRLHGLYLLTADEALHGVDDNDSAEGLLSDAIMTPHNKRGLLNNIALLEQLCSAPQGSVHSYRQDGSVVREDDPRSPAQHELCGEIRAGAVHYAQALSRLCGYPDPFADMDVAATWSGAVLARALLLPTDAELALLGPLRHDVNMGTQVTAPMADAQAARAFLAAKALPSACAPHEPPMWMAGSMAARSPLHGLFYALNCAGHLPGDVAGEAPCGETEVLLFADASPVAITVTCLRNGFGEFRLRVPYFRKSAVSAIAVPESALPHGGRLTSVSFQAGKTATEAMRSQFVHMLPVEQCQLLEGALVIPVPVPNNDIAMVTLTIVPPDGARIFAG